MREFALDGFITDGGRLFSTEESWHRCGQAVRYRNLLMTSSPFGDWQYTCDRSATIEAYSQVDSPEFR